MTIEELAELVAVYCFEIMKQHGFIVMLLAVIGLFSILAAVGEKIFQILKYALFLLAIPLIIIVGLINRKHRKERLKELGEIRAYLKAKPERWRAILFRIIIAVIGIVLILMLYFVIKGVIPFFEADIILRNETLWNITNNTFVS